MCHLHRARWAPAKTPLTSFFTPLTLSERIPLLLYKRGHQSLEEPARALSLHR